MRKSYGIRVREALGERRDVEINGVWWIVALVVAATIGYIVLALIVIPGDEPREYHFINEDGAVTALSAFYLVTAAAFSICTFVSLREVGDSNGKIWLLFAAGFSFLAFDEMLLFHERVGAFVDRFSESGEFRSWNDIVVILYGTIAILIMVVIFPALLRWRLVLEMFGTAFVFYGVHTLIDSVSEPPTTWSVILEESAKLMCGAFLVLGSFCGFVGGQRRAIASTKVLDEA